MRLTVLGAGGGLDRGLAGLHLLPDLGYATLPRLLEHVGAERVDAVSSRTGIRTTVPT
ncbi:hypothetical protein [Dactylosporangium sp. NPDC051484]|uniref:hypothetical protein n=1 Tax=Dactylosporangium sp. NPDC051484 TaxID=3154942 RepID=UPI0034502BD3